MDSGVGIPILLVFGGLSYAVLGWAAWTGRYRSWARFGNGYRVLIGPLAGGGLACIGAAALLANDLGGVLFLIGGALGFVSFLMVIVTFFIKDRWYPRWYHDEPGHRW